MGKIESHRNFWRSAAEVALAKHWLKTQVLLLDEPLSTLDLKLRKQMQIELKRLQSETGITFMLSLMIKRSAYRCRTA